MSNQDTNKKSSKDTRKIQSFDVVKIGDKFMLCTDSGSRVLFHPCTEKDLMDYSKLNVSKARKHKNVRKPHLFNHK